MKNILLAWIGNTDLTAAESGKGSGPIDQTVRERNYDNIVLLCNYRKQRREIYEKWFKEEFSGKTVSVYHADLTSPTNYSEIYENALKILEKVINASPIDQANLSSQPRNSSHVRGMDNNCKQQISG